MSLKDAQNHHYREQKSEWQTARRMFTGDFSPKQLLPRGPYEATLAYEKRIKIADFHRHTAILIGRLSGSLMQREAGVERTVGQLTPSLMASIGPEGESYRQQLSVLIDSLLLYNECWVWVNPTPNGAEMHVVSPLQVPRWKDDSVLMLGTASKPGVPIDQPEETDTTYTVHRPTGYQTYMIRTNNAGKEKRVEVDSGSYGDEAFFVDENGRPAPPIFRIRMPWKSPFGLSVAESHQQLYKMRNELDMGSTSGLNSSIATVTGVSGDEQEQKVVKAMKNGDQLVFLPDEAEMEPFELSTGNIEAAEARLQAKREDMYRTAYANLEESAQSATAAAVNRGESVGAALSQLAGTVESAEETILRFVEQSVNIQDLGGPMPQESDVSVDWPRDFQQVDLQGDSQGNGQGQGD
ncbi:hypothetical protein GGP85_002901 [Salinibacter ruber]|uniref:DUF4055 domain-containing protein n=1 Tax=Salinibacter ruber TaxID=146919 RepID=UPI002168AFFB|nr:DUF4055 domain-containing protein [Salinibacter ruber]MCS3827431.1 hypothetical protein [Salinibacter ruber]